MIVKLLLLGSIALLSGCSSWILFNAQGPVGQSEGDLIIICALLMLIVVSPVIILTIIFAWRYRQSNQSVEFIPNWKSLKIEMTTWLIPAIIVLILSILIWIYSHRLDPFRPISSKSKSLVVQVVSLDWKWLFIYPSQQIATINELVIPYQIPVHFYLTADSVINAFFIPQLGGQIMTMAGMQTELYLFAKHRGNFFGISSNYSGPGFNGMQFPVKAVSGPEFAHWISKIQQSSHAFHYKDYQNLKLPSKNVPIMHFFPVASGLFTKILQEYRTSHPNMKQSNYRST